MRKTDKFSPMTRIISTTETETTAAGLMPAAVFVRYPFQRAVKQEELQKSLET